MLHRSARSLLFVLAVVAFLQAQTWASDVSGSTRSASLANGDAFVAKEQWSQALACYKQASAADPASGLALAKHAYAASHLHKPDALAEFKRAVQLAPGDPAVWELFVLSKRVAGDVRGELACRTEELQKLPQTASMIKMRVNCLLARADAYGRLPDPDLAFKDLNAAISLSPDYYRPWMVRGIMYAAFKQDFPRGLSDLNRSLELNPHDGEILYNRANVSRMAGNIEQALKDYERACQLAPDNLEIRTCFEDFKLTSSKSANAAAAIKYCTEAIAASPTNSGFYSRRATAFEHNNDFKSAASDAAKAYSLNPKDVGMLKVHASIIIAHDQNLAFSLINQAISQHLQSASLLTARATLYQIAGQLNAADSDFASAIKLSPNDPDIWLARSHYYCSRSDFGKALPDVNRALELSPKSASLIEHRANILWLLGKKEPALAAYQSALKAEPENHSFRCAYERVKLDFNKSTDVTELIKCLNDAIKAGSPSSDFLYWRAEAFERKHDYASAVSDVVQAFAKDPATLPQLKDHVYALLAQKQSDRAVELLDRSIKLQPKLANLYVFRADVNVHRRKFDQVRQDLRTALQIDPDNFSAYRLEGDLNRDQLDPDGAVADYTKCLKVAPDDVATLAERSRLFRELGRPLECRSDLQHLCRIHPPSRKNVLVDLAWCEQSLHNQAEAERLYRLCLKENDYGLQNLARCELAKLLASEKRSVEAIKLFEQSDHNHPDSPALVRIARCYADMNDWQKAAEQLSLAIKASPRECFYYAERGDAFMQLHKYETAVGDYTMAVKYGKVEAPKFLRARAAAYEKCGKSDLAAKDRKTAADLCQDLLDNR